MTVKHVLRALISVLFATGMSVAQAGGEAVPASGADLRDVALSAARQRSVVEAAFRESAKDAARGDANNEKLRPTSAERDAVDPLSYTFKLRNTDVTLDFCSGTHLLMTSNLDSVTEVIVRP